MPELSELREALAANLEQIEDLQVSPYLLANPTPPAAEILPAPIEYDKTFGRGEDKWQLIVRVFVGITSDIGAQKLLDRFLASSGPDSVKAALESDSELGGKCDDLHVTRCSGYRTFNREGKAPMLGAEFITEIWASGA